MTGVESKKKCSSCGKELPTAGKGSKKCSSCGSVYVKNSDKTKASHTKSELSPGERRVQFFSLFMKEGEKPDLKNVIHNHTVIPVRWIRVLIDVNFLTCCLTENNSQQWRAIHHHWTM